MADLAQRLEMHTRDDRAELDREQNFGVSLAEQIEDLRDAGTLPCKQMRIMRLAALPCFRAIRAVDHVRDLASILQMGHSKRQELEHGNRQRGFLHVMQTPVSIWPIARLGLQGSPRWATQLDVLPFFKA